MVSRSARMRPSNDGALKPLPERLVMERCPPDPRAAQAIERSPDVALTLLLLKLVTDTFLLPWQLSGSLGASCLCRRRRPI